MDVDKIPYHSVQSVAFNIYGTEELKKLSVLEITNLKTLDALGHPTPGGLYDGALGPCDRDELCTTCGLVQVFCPGHIGHISLPLPVFNPVFFRSMYQLIRGSCFSCHSLLSPPFAIQLILAQLKVLDYGLVGVVQELEEVALETVAQSAGSGGIETLVKNKMTETVNMKLEGLNLESAKLSAQVKNVVECRQRITKTFIREYLMGAGRKCMSCGTPRKGMSIHNNSRIIFTANVRKVVKVKPKKPPAILKAPEMFDEYDDVEKENNQEEEEDKFTGQSYLTPLEARKHLHELWKKEQAILQRLFGLLVTAGKYHESPVDIFFLDAVIVPPSRFRPLMFMRGRKYENPQTASLNKVLQSCSVLRDVLHMLKKKNENMEEQEPLDENVKAVVDKLPGKTLGEKLDIAWNQLQININCVVDSDLDKLSTDKTPGVKQIIEKKEGLFRKNMMGKRVNYAARSVISPDPYIMVDEIGIPDVFAKKLTYPQPVTPWNVQILRQAVINGPDVHPGAVLVQNEDGSMVKLSPKDKCQREAIAKRLLTPSHSFHSGLQGSKIVYRHLQNGDVLLLNRQPTLHKPSIMAHRARVLPKEKTLRLHYANCKSYNADFDGDEMNAHFPQSELARSEAYNIASVNNQYLVPKDGTPLSGLIQDHIVAGVLLTVRGKFFTRADYQELVFGALTFVQKPIKLLPPAIIRPVVLWSGKQVVSTIIINVIPGNKPPPNIEGKAKVSVKNWQVECPKPWIAGGTPLQGESMSESEVIVRGGEILCGVLDKAHFGPTPYGLVHCCYELYGGQTSTLLLTSLARVFTHFLQIHAGFTLGIQDILITQKANKKRWKIMRSAETVGNEVAAEALDVTDSDNQEKLLDKLQDAHRSKDDRGMKQLDNVMKQITDSFNNKINRVCLPDGLIKKFPDNNLQLMAQSGAKGSSVNCMQISCLLGQIELEGRRVPLMLSGRSLPSFMPYDTSPRAGGFVAGRFLTGIRPQEYFFHCMAGREGLVDTAVKTSRSGYLQRCLIKHLEGIVINYDLTARDSDGSVIQFFYGEDSMDILKCQLLKEQQLSLMVKNHEAIIGEENLSEIAIKHDLNSVKKSKKEISKWKKKNKNLENNQRRSAFLTFSRAHLDSLCEKYSEVNFLTQREAAKEKLQDVWYSLEPKTKKRLVKENKSCPDPLTSRLRPDITFGSLPEKLENIVENYIATNPDNLISDDPLHSQSRQYITSEQFRNMIYLKSLKSLCDPGEAVGLLAAQSIGEPSTQMTLNTFHFAGRGEMNVTLGIPRLREILMVASANIATPSMDMPLLEGPDIEKKAEKLRLKLNKVHLFQILEEVTVTELLTVKERQNRHRSYKIHFKFLPYKAYKTHFYVNPSRVLHYMEKVFVKKLVLATRKKLLVMSEFRLLSTATRRERGSRIAQDEDCEGNAVAPEPDGGESSDEGEGDGDTTSTKFRRRHDQDLEYEEPEEEEMMKDEESESDDLEVESTVKQEEGEDDSQEVVLEDVVSKKIKKEQDNLDMLKAKRVNSVLSLNPWIVQYNFDTEKEEWCEVTLQLGLEGSKLDMTSLVEEEAKKAVIQETDKISRGFLITDPRSGGQILKTEGVNLREMFNYDQILDLNKIYSNDIHAVVSTYGIEAAAKSIVKEITNVFAVYGIEVDPRHLSLVADYMTFDGSYKPCNRIGMESSASPLQQMTFETTMNFLKSATLSGFQDPLKSPSSRLVLGHVVAGGTGSFDLLQPRINLSKKSKK